MYQCQEMHSNLFLAMLVSCPQQCGDIGRVLGQRWRAIADCILPSRRRDMTRNAQGDSVEFYRKNCFSFIGCMISQHDLCFMMDLSWMRMRSAYQALWQTKNVHGVHRALSPEVVAQKLLSFSAQSH